MTDRQETRSAWSPADGNSFEHAKAAFEQNFAQFRHLNEQMNRIPAFAVTLTGGFWYVAVVSNYGHSLGPVREHLARFALMLFAGLCDFTLVCIAIRVRDVMADYLDRVRRFEGEWWSERTPSLPVFRDYSMISMYSILIIAGALLSWVGAFVLFWPADHISYWWGILSLVCALVISVFMAYLLPRWLTR
ncbi:hypothetical protein [Sphingomonas faeni]|uniref:hypothetical protein n=1 Tax=Sphingomonas faeni TaxID=185950 RepID=UPI00334CB8C8